MLAGLPEARVLAIDLVPEFLAAVEEQVTTEQSRSQVHTVQADMNDLPLPKESFDLLWSEGAAYSMGFAEAARSWREFLAPQAILAVSEITWLTHERPREITEYWQSEYAQIDTASAKMEVLESNGYAPIGYFSLPSECWTGNFYAPLTEQVHVFEARHPDSEAAGLISAAEKEQIELYERFSEFYSYGFYIARRC